MSAIVYSCTVMDAAQMRLERERRGLTQDELGALVGEPGKNIGNWERAGHIPPKKVAKIEAVLLPASREESPLSSYSDARLVAEINARLAVLAQRLDALRQGVPGHIPDTRPEGYDVSDTVSSDDTASPDPGGPHKSEPRRIRGRGPRNFT